MVEGKALYDEIIRAMPFETVDEKKARPNTSNAAPRLGPAAVSAATEAYITAYVTPFSARPQDQGSYSHPKYKRLQSVARGGGPRGSKAHHSSQHSPQHSN